MSRVVKIEQSSNSLITDYYNMFTTVVQPYGMGNGNQSLRVKASSPMVVNTPDTCTCTCSSPDIL